VTAGRLGTGFLEERLVDEKMDAAGIQQCSCEGADAPVENQSADERLLFPEIEAVRELAVERRAVSQWPRLFGVTPAQGVRYYFGQLFDLSGGRTSSTAT